MGRKGLHLSHVQDPGVEEAAPSLSNAEVVDVGLAIHNFPFGGEGSLFCGEMVSLS